MFIIVIDPFCCNQILRLGPMYSTFTLPLRRELCRATNTGGSAPDPREREGRERGRREGEGEKGGGRKGGKGGEGIIHLLLPQAHIAVAAYDFSVVHSDLCLIVWTYHM